MRLTAALWYALFLGVLTMTSSTRFAWMLDEEQTEVGQPGGGGGSPLTTHILDTSLGRPAATVYVTVHKLITDSGAWTRIGQCTTDSDGRCGDLLTQAQFSAAVYKLNFNTGEYFKKMNTNAFYPFVEVVFKVDNPTQHYHVPLLLNPFGYSTYRGS